jgi:hypothetical protein
MMNLFLLSVLVGAVLGMRLRVLILVPAMGFSFIAIAGIGTARGDPLYLVALAMVFAAISLQLGYLVGSTARFITASSRVSRRYEIQARVTTSSATERPTIGI